MLVPQPRIRSKKLAKEYCIFLGQVDEYDAGVVRVTGHSYVPDIIGGLMIQKPEELTKILALSSGTLLGISYQKR